MTPFARNYIHQTIDTLNSLDFDQVESCIQAVEDVATHHGRLFIIGSGGSAANASHAVNDFRKLCRIEAYCPSDNVAELTARVNDESWDTSYSNWLLVSRIRKHDCLLVLSVGGGSLQPKISPNIVHAITVAKSFGATVIGIVGRDGGYTASNADAYVLIPNHDPNLTTPHAEELQSILLHLMVSEPRLRRHAPRWESVCIQ